MRAMGFEYKTMETEDDCHIVVAEAHCRYDKPAHYDELLRVRTRVTEWRNRIVKFSYVDIPRRRQHPADDRLYRAQ